MAAVPMVVSGSLLLAMLAGSARADEPAKARTAREQAARSATDESAVAAAKRGDLPQTTFTLESINNPPPREVKVKSFAPNGLYRLMAAKFPVYRNKFVAVLRMQPPKSSGVRNALMASAAYPSASFGDRTIFSTPADYSSRTPPYEAQWAEKFAAIVDRVPADHRPPQEVIDFFTNPKLSQEQFEQDDRRAIALVIGADSAEQAETRAKGLLTLLDWGVSRPLQLEIWKQREEYLAQLATERRAVDETAKKLGPQRAVLDSLGEAPTAKLIDLTVARVGVEARIQSLSKHPAADGLQKNLFEAEAELAEIDAQIALHNDLNAYRHARRELSRVEQELSAETAALATFAPIALVDNEIQIHETGDK
jgi:hypothetical protein